MDRRADIWAFGVVLYEMLTGRQAFPGETITDTLAAVLNSEPDYSCCPADLPPRIQYLLKRCLRKKPAERLGTSGKRGSGSTKPRSSLRRRAPSRRGWWIALCWARSLPAFCGRSPVAGSSAAATPAWKGTFLGGPSHALGPRISPDGKTLAFQAMVDGLLQVAVMKPETGNWTVLTREREHGAVQEIAWSPDGTRLYFSRMLGSPRGIYSIPVLGGEERLVLEAAANPEMLPDGSLLVLKIDAKRQFQIHHYWPETGKLEPLAAEVDYTDISAPLRTFPGWEGGGLCRPAADE